MTKRKKGGLPRDAEITVIMGKNGTGKSTFVENILNAINHRAIVVTLNGAPKIWRQYPIIDPSDRKEMKSFEGIRQVLFFQHEEKTFEYLHRNFHDGTLVFDDCRGYLSSNVDSNQDFKRILMDFRHKMLDLFFVVHSPADLPPRLWGFYSTAWIGATDALFSKSRLNTHSADKLIQAQKIVNDKFRTAKMKGDNSHYGIFKRVIP